MTFAPQARSNLSKLLFFATLLLVAIVILYSRLQNRPWAVPEDAKKITNPLVPSKDAISAAHSIYLDKCAECHGDSGKGDGPQAKMYSPGPSDLTDAFHFNTQTDGELFYKVTHGHKPMPSFGKRLTDEQRWQLVLLIRELSKPVAPPEQRFK